jgi:hypothetical protein
MRKVVLAVFLGACALSLLAAAPARANCYELIGCSNKDRYKVSESSRRWRPPVLRSTRTATD